ncbi:RNA polymerase sigma factor (sigma-70 family) [Streptomyces sp. 3330]|uniref:sigma-70 family RNA polymerase sigma factor n=1 Tax=Streptomyces sp. 3330 TaxID=2817755 RepID=UPI00285BA839|nr:sigma-70 family RNA polymerase sigma factor [Streptomyces sp. 3330]MDR6976066.1 RNA polymerase sigma factor (sigma-70 family) [Streptomyces sp. 3330]
MSHTRTRPGNGRALPDAAVVVAARAGDRRALDRLVAAYLPLIYNIVGRAMDGHPDVDDVVQNTMMRAVDHLPALDDPDSFRAWLVAIAVRQARTWDDARRRHPEATPPDELTREPDPWADFTELTVLRLELTGQRREAVEAARWLDEEEREFLSLWWMEAAGRLTRAEWTRAGAMTADYAAVRVKRVKERLEAARAILRALATTPRCPGLDALLPSWDGRPGPLWRKRLHRHVRDCPRCRQAATGMVPAERLLGDLALVPLPVGLAAHLLTSSAPAASLTPSGAGPSGPGPAPSPATGVPQQAGRIARTASRLTRGAVVTATAGVLAVAGVTLWSAMPDGDSSRPPSAAPDPARHSASPSVTTRQPEPSPEPASASAPPSSAAPTRGSTDALLGDHALRFGSRAGQYMAAYPGRIGIVVEAGPASPVQVREAATFTVVPGLSAPACYSLRDDDGTYLRHSGFRLRLAPDDGSPLFDQDATFCLRGDPDGGSVFLRSVNYTDRYVRYRDGQLYLDPVQDTAAYWDSASFRFTDPLA